MVLKLSHYILWSAAALVVSLSQGAEAMPLAEFLTKTDKLERRGALAAFSSDYKLLTGEYQRVSLELHQERLRDLREGRKPAYCPKENQTPVTPTEALSYFRSIQPQRRAQIQVKDAFLQLLVRRYPC